MDPLDPVHATVRLWRCAANELDERLVEAFCVFLLDAGTKNAGAIADATLTLLGDCEWRCAVRDEGVGACTPRRCGCAQRRHAERDRRTAERSELMSQDRFPGQDAAVLRLVDGLAWGSLWDEVPDFVQTFERLLHAAATFAPLSEWESNWEDEHGYSFNLSREQVEALPDEARLALVADLVRWLHITWGTNLAQLVCGLNDLMNTGTTFEDATRI
jgi:hypothetical protein